MTVDPLSAISGLAALAKTVGDIANSNDSAQRNALLIEFQKALIQTQGITASEQVKNASLVARIQDLEHEIARLRDWGAERERYELKEVAAGLFARIDRGYEGNFQSAHKYCATCFEQGIKSPLQQQPIEIGRKLSLSCYRCNSTTVFRHYIDQT
jgi:hypothetical protein